MNFLLKIVEGPNKGAEIALVKDVAVTLGKGDDCDIVLADPTLPEAPFQVSASDDGVAIDGEALPPFHVKTAGSTSFAIGPADAPWGELVWPKAEPTEAPAPSGDVHEDQPAQPEREEETPPSEEKPKRGCLGCIIWILVFSLVLSLVLAALAWFFREQIRPHAENAWEKVRATGWFTWKDGDPGEAGSAKPSGQPVQTTAATIESVAAKYGLSITNIAGRAVVCGNMRTRAERLAATAEAYAAKPGVDLDISDDESFATAAADALFTLTEGALKVVVATNRFLVISGFAPSAPELTKTLEALAADMPRLRNVDVRAVSFAEPIASMPPPQTSSWKAPAVLGRPAAVPPAVAQKIKAHTQAMPTFPVCGILTTPYRCLVMRDGRRIMEGSAIDDCVIVEIGADSVTLTNSTGRFTWKP